MLLSKVISCVMVGALVLASNLSQAQENFLQETHERQLKLAQILGKKELSDKSKADMLIMQAAALDSLDRSQEALPLVEQALRIATPEQHASFTVTKATIFFTQGRAADALALLAPLLESERQAAAAAKPDERAGRLAMHQSGFILAAFSSVELGDWKNALAYLADTEYTSDEPEFAEYRAVVYRYIMARANDASLANANLEKQAVHIEKNSKSHYGALLRMWQGADNLTELSRLIARKDAEEQQDAFAESLFYIGAYTKYVKRDPALALNSLQQLNRISPYGSLEWVHGKRVLAL